MKIGGTGEQAIRVQVYELRRLNELPEEVQILGVLPELSRDRSAYELQPDWVPHPRPKPLEARCLYVHVQHRYCFRGTENGAPLTVEDFEDFLRRWADLREDELSKRGLPVVNEVLRDAGWVDDDA
jgi:hypothetical protein